MTRQECRTTAQFTEYAPIFDVLSLLFTSASAKVISAETPSMTGRPNSWLNCSIRSAIPAQPNTITSALSQSIAARISARIFASVAGSPSSSLRTGITVARTRTHFCISPYRVKLFSSPGTERDKVVMTLNLVATMLAA